jgi:3-deoxy-D-manno-octulosonate 8-phosphate phosphatase (KDO 8-P phosphatase)
LIEIIFLDIDGTMTDGKIVYSNEGESKSFSVKDGLGVATWNKMGKISAIITGRTSDIVERRASELKCKYIYQGVFDKGEVVEEILKKEGLSKEQSAAIGDDLNDFKMLKAAGLRFAPNDFSRLIEDEVDVVLNAKGGEGAVREMIEYIIKKDGLQERFVEIYKK